MKNLIIVLSILFLSGCSFNVSKEELKTVNNKCSRNDGVKVITVYTESICVICEDGAEFNFPIKNGEMSDYK